MSAFLYICLILFGVSFPGVQLAMKMYAQILFLQSTGRIYAARRFYIGSEESFCMSQAIRFRTRAFLDIDSQ